MAVTETTPLLETAQKGSKISWASPSTRLLIASLLISVALTFTQVPILYAFRIMECEEFYTHHEPPRGTGDKCDRNEVDGGTAAQVSLLGITTTFCGILNLFVAGWQIRRLGLKMALVFQTGLPTVRLAAQVVAVTLGGRLGIVIMQTTQLVTIFGGPAGYLLVLNTGISEVVEPKKRTGVFGQLQGCVMLGTAAGYLVGGRVGEVYGIRRPFEVAFFLFALSCLYASLCTPYIDPPATDSSQQPAAKGLSAYFGPLRVLLPQKVQLQCGVIKTHKGVLFLALGVFMGVLATGYAPILIQMYATAAFHFRSSENGYLMSVNSLIRGAFLIFVFPGIISKGRRWYSGSEGDGHQTAPDGHALPTHPEDFEPPEGILPEQEPPLIPPPSEKEAGCGFDLLFLRWSLVADGLVTAYTALATQNWHIYLAGFLLPLASGSAPASKGVITEMVAPSQRADALQAMTLVENTAMLSTLGMFGLVFSAFSDVGKAHLTFYCNAVVALTASCVLLSSRFPPNGSRIINSGDQQCKNSEAVACEDGPDCNTADEREDREQCRGS